MHAKTSLERLSVPLCVDLDGTLIDRDMLVESFLLVAQNHPAALFSCGRWLMAGKAVLKAELAARALHWIHFPSLPYHLPVLEHLQQEKELGRMLVLATASDIKIAEGVAEHLQFFDRIFASDGVVNMKGPAKRDALMCAYPDTGYEYIGNSHDDFPVWEGAIRRSVAYAPRSVVDKLQRLGPIERVFTALKK